MKSWLDIRDERDGIYVAWWDDEGAEGDSVIGQDAAKGLPELEREKLKALKNGEADNFDYFSIEVAAVKYVAALPENERPFHVHFGFRFESTREARAFLKAMDGALKVARAEFRSGRAAPPWAAEAIAAGWRPPKGFK